jgi:hypothetical protein
MLFLLRQRGAVVGEALWLYPPNLVCPKLKFLASFVCKAEGEPTSASAIEKLQQLRRASKGGSIRLPDPTAER